MEPSSTCQIQPECYKNTNNQSLTNLPALDKSGCLSLESSESIENVQEKVSVTGSDHAPNDAVVVCSMAVNSHLPDEINKTIGKPRKLKRITTVMDSDSEPEDRYTSLENRTSEKKDVLSPKTMNSRRVNRSFIDSDESDSNEKKNVDPFGKGIVSDDGPKKSRLYALLDSDSSDCKESNDNSRKINDLSNDKECKADVDENMGLEEAPIYITSKKGELIIENFAQNSLQRSRIAALCDPDSDEDYPLENTNYCNIEEKPVSTKSGKYSRKTKAGSIEKDHKGKGNKSKTKEKSNKMFKMTPKEAAQQREEIAAESQRMAREKNVSLPYHKPKVHTLQEFLTRRSKLASVVPITSRRTTSIATAVRMTNEQLAVFQKRLEEREKELEEFYKSDSESDMEDPNDTEYILPGVENTDSKNQPDCTDNTQLILDSLDNEEMTAEKEELNVEEPAVILDENNETNEQEGIVSDLENNENEAFENVSKASVYINTEDKFMLKSNAGFDGADSDKDLDNHKKNDASSLADTNKSSGCLAETEPFSLKLEETELMNENNEDDDNELINDNIEDKKNVDTDNTVEDVEMGEAIASKTEEHAYRESEPDSHRNNSSYEFNLNDSEDHSDLSKSNNEINADEKQKEINERDNGESSRRRFEYTELDAEIENFGNDTASKPKINILSDVVIPSKQIEIQKCSSTENAVPKSRLQLLKEKLANTTPKLSGGPNDFIVLEDKETSAAVTKLMERFAKHATKKYHSAHHKVSLNIVTVESCGDIHQETVAINVDDDDDDVHVIEEKPGVKLQKLRKELQTQMEKEKSERWQKKASDGLKPSTTETDTKEGYEDDLPDEYDDEEEEILTDEDELDDEELEEDDVDLKDKPAKKSQFVDEEAEESETEDLEPTGNPSEDVEDEESDLENDATSDCEVLSADESSNMTSESACDDELPDLTDTGKNRPHKRIIKAFDDSDDSDCENESKLEKTLTNETDNAIETTKNTNDEEEEISVYQRQPDKTPIRQITQPKPIEFNTPVSFITGLENLRSASKSLKGSPAPIVSPFQMPQDSPLKPSFSSVSQKKLFTESDADSQESIDILETQPEPTQTTPDIEGVTSMNLADTLPKEDTPCTQDILNICSGDFTGVTQIDSTERSAISRDYMVLDTQNQTQEVKSLGEDLIISQLLDEEELENFKKKFESPVNKPSPENLTQKLEEAKETPGGGRFLDSDDDDGDDTREIKKNKRSRKIAFSDDESSDEDGQSEEEIDLHDNEGIEDEEIDNVEYDSEENEIDLNEPKKEKIKIQDFMENEAELSESEWGSEDEDEKDLDKLEFEAGDTEKFDEEQMKEDLDKIHLRRLLDDDTREVKLLQELLLEDGEMHGTGRQRQFRWKNIDDADDVEDDTKRPEDGDYFDEEESEEQWRRRRHEREMFLKEKASQSQDVEQDVLLGTSKLLTIGQRILQKSQSLNNSQGSATPPENPAEKNESPLLHKFTLLNKRGSFLSRGEDALQKVAYFTKECTINLNGSKTNKSFVFQSVSSTSVTMQTKKRKAADGTPDVLKKLRLSNNFSPGADAKKRKSERKKRLF